MMINELNNNPEDLVSQTNEGIGIDEIREVPKMLGLLPDGSEALVIGDVEGLRQHGHKQGNNELGFLGDCGLVSCENVLRGFGQEVTENDIVCFAVANGLCTLDERPQFAGGTTLQNQADILNAFGVPAHYEMQCSLDDLAEYLEEGRGVIIQVDSSVLWNQPSYTLGNVDHAITLTGVAHDPATGEIRGFYVNDSGSGSSGRFVDRDVMDNMFNGSPWGGPGACVVTDIVSC
jgi:hypothetical protein